MRKDILTIAKKEFKRLAEKYNGFINVVVDDWRGYRFVFDTEDTRKCDNSCAKCSLYQLLKNEKEGLFSAGLYPANEKDKALFGPQNFLNCKTLSQYKDCYVNYVLKNPKEADKEIELIRSMNIIYSQEGEQNEVEIKFKTEAIGEISVIKTKI